MSAFTAAAIKLLDGAIGNFGDDLLSDALEAEQITATTRLVHDLGRLLDEIDLTEAVEAAEQRLMEIEAREHPAVTLDGEEEEPSHGYWEKGDY
jgi:hypothetical protein